MKPNKLINKPVLLSLFPLLIYILIVIFLSKNALEGDEPRYINYAKNLLNGFYSPPYPNIDLWSGPGYPLLISLFLGLGLPLIAIKIANAFFWYLSVVFLYLSLKELKVSYKNRLICCAILSFAFPYFLFFITFVYTEVFVLFLVSVFCYLMIRFQQPKIGLVICTGFVLSLIILTKIIFAYVGIAFLIGLLIISLFMKSVKNYLLIVFTAFVFTLPYQIYTFNLTRKVFYWSNSGGASLFWMSSPYKNELGDWYNSSFFIKSSEADYNEFKTKDVFEYGMLVARDSAMKRNHSDYFKSISKMNPLEIDTQLKKKAMQNIKSHPNKYVKNWIANLGRFFFHYPFSYRDQTINTYMVLIPSFIILQMFTLTILFAKRWWNAIPLVLKLLLLFGFIYVMGSSFLSAYSRFFMPVLPILIIWIGFVYDKFKKAGLTKSSNLFEFDKRNVTI